MRNLKGVSLNLPDAELDALLVERNRRVLEAELARRNMAAFVSFTKRDYCHNRFSRAVCEALDLFLEDGRGNARSSSFRPRLSTGKASSSPGGFRPTPSGVSLFCG